MRRSTLLIMAALLVVFAASISLLSFYEVDLVDLVVVNALIQKAPRGYPVEKIQDAFAAARRRAENSGAEDAYLERLFQLSQRLEKVQTLTAAEIDQILESLERPEIEPE